MHVRFILVCEGPSDAALVQPLEALCVEVGASEVSGVAPDLAVLPVPPGRSVAEKVDAALKLEPNANLVFVHRDSDNRDHVARYQEVATALTGHNRQWVAVVPVQETEAWLLVDPQAIRVAASHPNGKDPLGLPHVRRIEELASPKEVLRQALITACGYTGRRLQRFRKRIPSIHANLVRGIDINGPIKELPAWVRLVKDTRSALTMLQDSATQTNVTESQ